MRAIVTSQNVITTQYTPYLSNCMLFAAKWYEPNRLHYNNHLLFTSTRLLARGLGINSNGKEIHAVYKQHLQKTSSIQIF